MTDILSTTLDPARLEALILRASYVAWGSELLRNATRLQRLRLVFPLTSRECPSFTLPTVLETLRHLIQLRELTLHLALPSWDKGTAPSDAPLDPGVDLPFLTYLEVYDEVEDTLFFARHLRISSLCRTYFDVIELDKDVEHTMILLRQTFDCRPTGYHLSVLRNSPFQIDVQSYTIDSQNPHRHLRIYKAKPFTPYITTIAEYASVWAGDLVLLLDAGIDLACWELLFRCFQGKPLRVDMPKSPAHTVKILDSLTYALRQGDLPIISACVLLGVHWSTLTEIDLVTTAFRMYARKSGVRSISLRLEKCRDFPDNALEYMKGFDNSFELSNRNGYTAELYPAEDLA